MHSPGSLIGLFAGLVWLQKLEHGKSYVNTWQLSHFSRSGNKVPVCFISNPNIANIQKITSTKLNTSRFIYTMLKKFEFYFHFVEILLWGLALLCNWHGSSRLDYSTSHATFCPKGTENWFCNAHAVMILILLYTLVGRQVSHSLGKRQRR